ncbi:MAG: hypothetical protein EPN97_00570 [Alphaproteobacteria bacterium]|nr:MAG: hypothetical protein EPN97_00570 [Alphaproteobacteria bacterium]
MRRSFTHLLLLCLLLVPAAARAGDPVGAVKEMTGAATIQHAGESEAHAVAQSAPIFMKDVIEAKDDAHVKMKFADGAEFILSGRGKFTVDEYVYDPKAPEKGKSTFSLLGAAFSYVGGLIDKGGETKSSLHLDFGSIGIRGTKILSAFAGGGNWIYLENGKITVDTTGGQVIVSPGEGTSITSKSLAPEAPYAFSADEIAWLQRVIDDPQARAAGAMASNAAPPLGRARAQSQMAAAEAPAPALEGVAKDKAALDEMPAKKESRQTGNEMAAAPAAQPAQMPSAAGGAGAGAPAAASAPAAPPVIIAATPASPPAASEPLPAEAGKAEAKANAKANAAAAPRDVIPLKKLSAATLGTRISQDGDAVRIDTQTPATINIATADISAQHLENTTLLYRAAMKARGLSGTAYLEMWVHFPGEKGGSYFSRGLDNQLVKEEDWKEFLTPFFLKPGEVPDTVTLNLVINGRGTVWIRDVRLQR